MGSPVIAASGSQKSGPPLPESLLPYPLFFSRVEVDGEGEDEPVDDVESPTNTASKAGSPSNEKGDFPVFREITLFTALFWLLPLYVLSGWLDRKDPAVANAIARIRQWSGNGRAADEHNPEEEETEANLDVRVTRLLLPLFDRFFEEKTRLVPPNAQVYRQVQAFTMPTPKGARTVSRAKVEGDEQPPRPSFVQQSTAAAVAAAVNAPGIFCLWPTHNQFLIHYEAKEKLSRMNYVELDRLRFAFVAVKDLLEEYKVFHLHDGTITGLSKRDIKKNCASDARWAVNVGSADEAGSSKNNSNSTPGSVGRGGGNARLHQGTSGNVVTAPSTEAIQLRKEALQKRFLKEELQNMCLARWPHSPIAKSCVFVIVEEKKQCDLNGSEPLGTVSGPSNFSNNKGGKRKGPTYYLAAVDLPLFNKKGGTARFRGAKWWTVKADAESDAAEVAIRALQNLKA